jgi:hypothetical protein
MSRSARGAPNKQTNKNHVQERPGSAKQTNKQTFWKSVVFENLLKKPLSPSTPRAVSEKGVF